MNESNDGTNISNASGFSQTSIVVTALAGLFIASTLVWFFGFDLAMRGIGGVLLIALILTGVGAVIVGVAITIMGMPAVGLLPIILLGAKTLAVLVGVSVLLFVLIVSLNPSSSGGSPESQ